MKRINYLVLIFVFLIGIIPFSYAQMFVSIVSIDEVLKADPIDDVLFTIQYETTFIPDTINPDKPLNETMVLKVGKKSSVYYSYAKFLTDSIIEIDKATGASMDVIQNHMKQYTSKISYKIYKNYPAGKLTYLDQIAISKFCLEEKYEPQKWELLKDTTTILSYPCKKATCKFRGRTYEVWYTPEIPRSEGPWKLHGLPGLILKAQDTQGHYKFECTGITNGREGDQIMYSKDGYQPVSAKDMNKMYERFAKDPVGFIKSSSPNVTMTITDETGQPANDPKDMPFNPIER